MYGSLTAGDGAVYTSSPEVTLTPFDNSWREPYACFDWGFDAYTATTCVDSDSVQTGRHGYAYKSSNP